MAPTPEIYQLFNRLVEMGVVIEYKWDADNGQKWQLYIPDSVFIK